MISRWKLLLLNATGFHTENFQKKRRRNFYGIGTWERAWGVGLCLLTKLDQSFGLFWHFPTQPPSRPNQLQANGGSGIKICFFLLAAAKIPQRPFFLHLCTATNLGFFFGHFLFQSRSGWSLCLVENEQVCVGTLATGFYSQRRGVLHAAPSAPQAVGYICSLCCNHSQYGANACPLEDVTITICQAFTVQRRQQCADVCGRTILWKEFLQLSFYKCRLFPCIHPSVHF